MAQSSLAGTFQADAGWGTSDVVLLVGVLLVLAVAVCSLAARHQRLASVENPQRQVAQEIARREMIVDF
ncbi:MAG: hypothetical protein S0880_27110 [Actinomycetota bacterium]|nr:hypothetical protein [Actinomycetota bacterium]